MDEKPRSTGSFGRLEAHSVVPRPTENNEGDKRIKMGEDGDIITFTAGVIVEGLDYAVSGNAPDLTDYYNKETIDNLLVDKEDVTTGDTHALKTEVEALTALDIKAVPSGLTKDVFEVEGGDDIEQDANIETVAGAIQYNLELIRQVGHHTVSNQTNTDFVTLVQSPNSPHHLPLVSPNTQTELNGEFNEMIVGMLEHEVEQEAHFTELDEAVEEIKADYLPLYGGQGHKMTDDLYMQENFIQGVADPVRNRDAATKLYVDNKVTDGAFDGGTIHNALTLDSAGWDIDTTTGVGGNLKYAGSTRFRWSSSTNTMYKPLSMNSNKITNLAAPTSDNHAATKSYVDNNAPKAVEVGTDSVPPSSRPRGTLYLTTSGKLYVYS